MKKAGDTHFGCLVDQQDCLVSCAFGPSSKTLERHLSDYSKRVTGVAPAAYEHWLTAEMIRLFEGKKPSRNITLRTSFTSDFQRKVYSLLSKIPKGKVTTYGLISKQIHSAPRAIGRAVASNPWPLFVECHRVINANLTIGNYGVCGNISQEGTATKRGLLLREGVTIHYDRIERTSLWNPSEKTD